jgi:hypothetical protein
VLQRAVQLIRDIDPASDEGARWLWLIGPFNPGIITLEIWDDASWHELAALEVQLARDAGALRQLQFALNYLALAHVFAGEFTVATALVEEDRAIADATGNAPVALTAAALPAWRGQEARATEVVETFLQDAAARGQDRMLAIAAHASSVLYNGLGRHDAALHHAQRAFERDDVGFGPMIVPELLEAASRTGEPALAAVALDWLTERAAVTPTEWALGIQARGRALLSEGADAERHHRESIEHLHRCRIGAHQARAHLLYGEWLRRERRRADAR